MAATVTKLKQGGDVLGKHRVYPADVLLDNSYPTGGYAISAQRFGARSIVGVEPIGSPAGVAGGYSLIWDTTNNKLMAFFQDAGGAFGEVTAATDLSAITVRCNFWTRQGQ